MKNKKDREFANMGQRAQITVRHSRLRMPHNFNFDLDTTFREAFRHVSAAGHQGWGLELSFAQDVKPTTEI